MATPIYDPSGNIVGYQGTDGAFQSVSPAQDASPSYGPSPGDTPAVAPVSPDASGLTPDAVWNANVQQESGGRAGAIGQPTQHGTALGATQLLPDTAKEMAGKLGVPWRPDLLTATSPDAKQYQLQLGRAYFDQGVQKYNGNLQKAVMYYHGGPNEAIWGQKTRAHAAAVLQRASASIGPSQPLVGNSGQDTVGGYDFGSGAGSPSPSGAQSPASGYDFGADLGNGNGSSGDYDFHADLVPGGNASAPPAPGNATFQNNRGVQNAKTGQSATQAQADFYRNGIKTNSVDPNSDPGTEQFPLLATNNVDLPDPGQWYVDLNGVKHQVPGGPGAVSQRMGFEQGFAKPYGKLDEIIGGVADKLGYEAAPWVKQMAHNLQAAQAQSDAQHYAGMRPGKTGAFIGEIAGTSPIMAIPGADAGYVGAAATGAAQGALLSDKHDAGGLALDALGGAVGGAVTHGVMNKIAGAVSPKISQAVATLKAQGVTDSMTPGQLAGGLGNGKFVFSDVVPFVGDAIKAARGRSIDAFNQGAYKQVLEPLGKTMPPDLHGQDAIAHLGKAVGDAFEDVKPNITIKPDTQFATDVANVARNRVSSLPDTEANTFAKIFKNKISNNVDPQTGLINGDMFKKTDSELGRIAADYSGSGDADQRQLGYALLDTQAALRDAMARQNPSMVAPVNAANKAYSMYTLLRDTAAKTQVAGRGGVFTPYELLQTIRSNDPSYSNRAFAEGTKALQPYAQAGHALLPNKYPDSGTAGRGILGTLVTGGLLYGGNHISHGLVGEMATSGPGILGLLGGGLAVSPYFSKTIGKGVSRAMASDRPEVMQSAADILRRGNSKFGGLIGGTFAHQYTKGEPGMAVPVDTPPK